MSTKTDWKISFRLLVNLKEKQLKKLAKGLLSKVITLKEHLAKGGKPNLKSMYKLTMILKRKVVIQNKIMIHF
jgi:hypothetical protein